MPDATIPVACVIKFKEGAQRESSKASLAQTLNGAGSVTVGSNRAYIGFDCMDSFDSETNPGIYFSLNWTTGSGICFVF